MTSCWCKFVTYQLFLRKSWWGKGYNVITLHDINLESLSKFLWMWAKSGSIHDETAEFKNELLDRKRFGMDGVVAHVQTNWKTP